MAGRIEAAEGRVGEIDAVLGSATFYQDASREEAGRLGEERGELLEEIDRLMAEWEALEAEMEEGP